MHKHLLKTIRSHVHFTSIFLKAHKKKKTKFVPQIRYLIQKKKKTFLSTASNSNIPPLTNESQSLVSSDLSIQTLVVTTDKLYPVSGLFFFLEVKVLIFKVNTFFVWSDDKRYIYFFGLMINVNKNEQFLT